MHQVRLRDDVVRRSVDRLNDDSERAVGLSRVRLEDAVNECGHKWDAESCLFCRLERERDALRAEVERLRDELDRMRPHAEGCNWQRRGDAYPCSCMTEAERLREWAALQKGLKEQTQEQLDETLARCERLRETLRQVQSAMEATGQAPDGMPDPRRPLATVVWAALAGAPSERIIHLSRVPFVALCGADKRDQTTIESDDPSDTTCQSCRDRALAERVRSRIAAAAYDAGRADLAAQVRALDLDALMEEP